MNVVDNPSKSPATRWPTLIEVALFAFLLIVGIGSRFWLADMPNFKPVAAIALFAGFYFRSLWLPVLAICLVLAISDLSLGGYEWQLALAVYGSMIFAIGLGRFIQSSQKRETRPGLQTGFAFLLASLAMSTVFFVSTNLAVWKFSGWYTTDGNGLIGCFAAAIPFYRWTLTGDLFFTGVIFTAYALGGLLVSRMSEFRDTQPEFVS